MNEAQRKSLYVDTSTSKIEEAFVHLQIYTRRMDICQKQKTRRKIMNVIFIWSFLSKMTALCSYAFFIFQKLSLYYRIKKKVTEIVFPYLDRNISFISLFQNSFNHFPTEFNSSFKLTLISVKYVKYLRKTSLLNCIYSRIFNRRFLRMRISFGLFTDFAGLLIKLFFLFLIPLTKV